MLYSRAMKLLSISATTFALCGCGLASLPGDYSASEKQTLQDLDRANFAPRSDADREAILTQDLFTQAAFWSHEYDLNPADLEAAINLSAALRKLNKPSKAIEITQHTRALYPRDPQLISELAAAYVAENDPQKAIKVIDEGLKYAPNTARLWSLKGASLDQLDRFTEARQSYSRALSINPNDAGTLANVGLSYALEGDPNTAEIWLRRAAGQPGATPGIRQNLALVLGLQGRYDDAKNLIRQDMNPETVANNLDYLHSLRGPSEAPKTAQDRPQPRYNAPTQASQNGRGYTGQPQMGSRIQPQTRSQSDYQVRPQSTSPQSQPRTYGQTKTATYTPSQRLVGAPTARQNPQSRAAAYAQGAQSPQYRRTPRAQAQPPQSILSKIKHNNTPKIEIAHQRQMALQQQQNLRMPPPGYPQNVYNRTPQAQPQFQQQPVQRRRPSPAPVNVGPQMQRQAQYQQPQYGQQYAPQLPPQTQPQQRPPARARR